MFTKRRYTKRRTSSDNHAMVFNHKTVKSALALRIEILEHENIL